MCVCVCKHLLGSVQTLQQLVLSVLKALVQTGDALLDQVPHHVVVQQTGGGGGGKGWGGGEWEKGGKGGGGGGGGGVLQGEGGMGGAG